ncbi:MAG: hypothetical protein K2Q23_18200 [Bryobacteraceae bacterium]|nr:hypothetical protein [Bryobacteraceae bacterium]
MSADFLAVVLEGFEGTLDEVLVRSLPMELREIAEALQQHIAAQREQVDALAACSRAG